MRQPGATYPSDEVRRRIKPHVRIHHSVANHPKTAAIWADPFKRGILTELWRLASVYGAAHTGDRISLSDADLHGITGVSRRYYSLTILRTVTVPMGYQVDTDNGVVTVQLRKFAEKQNIAPRRNGVTPHTPRASPPPVPTPHTPTKEKKNTLGGKPPGEFESEFAEFIRPIYPRRDGDQRWRAALRGFCSARKHGETLNDMRAGVQRYAAWCENRHKIGTATVKQAGTFFGPEQSWREQWELNGNPDLDDTYYPMGKAH